MSYAIRVTQWESGTIRANQSSVARWGKQWQARVVRSTVRVRTVSEEAMAERLQAGDATRWILREHSLEQIACVLRGALTGFRQARLDERLGAHFGRGSIAARAVPDEGGNQWCNQRPSAAINAAQAVPAIGSPSDAIIRTHVLLNQIESTQTQSEHTDAI